MDVCDDKKSCFRNFQLLNAVLNFKPTKFQSLKFLITLNFKRKREIFFAE